MISNKIDHSTYHDSVVHYEDSVEFYDKEDSGFNDYPPEFISLSGRGLSEYNMFNELGSTQYNTGIDRLVQSMRTILQTRLGTRFFLPSFGSRLPELIFQQNDDILKELADLYVRDAIKKWEPRVTIESVNIINTSSSKVHIEIHFKPKLYPSTLSFVYTLNRNIKDID